MSWRVFLFPPQTPPQGRGSEEWCDWIVDITRCSLCALGFRRHRQIQREHPGTCCVRRFLSALLVAMCARVRTGYERSAHLSFLRARFPLPFARVGAAVHMQYFTRGERGVGEKQSGVDDFFDLTDSANRLQPFEEGMS